MKPVQVVILCFLLISSSGNAQSYNFEPLDQHPDSNYIGQYISSSDSSSVDLSLETAIVKEGAAAVRLDWRAERADHWGGFTRYEFWHPDSGDTWSFAPFENLSFWYYNDMPSSDPGRVQFRLQLFEVSDAPANTYVSDLTEMWYSFEYILDDPPGWNQIVLPLVDVGPAATSGGNGFWRTGWAGISGNDRLDLDQIKGIGMEISIDGPLTNELHSGQIIIDDLAFQGSRELPLIFFNGQIIHPFVNNHFAWNSSTEVVPSAGADPNTAALRWSQWPNNPWAGFGFEFDPQLLTFRWNIDSLRFKIKAPSGTSTLRVQFADAAGNSVKKLIDEPGGGYNNQWREMAIALKDIDTFESGTVFDTSAVVKFEVMAEGTGNGHIIYFDDIWTGRPLSTGLPPSPPLFFVVADSLSNLITWSDVPNLTGETYNIYYSYEPITDINGPGIEVVEQGIGVAENTSFIYHLLFTPLNPLNLDIYYAVTTVDQSGNESEPGLMPTAVNNTERGIGVINIYPQINNNFVADGDFSEWNALQPIEIKPSLGAHIVPNTVVSNDADLSMALYMATDNDYFYFAVEMNDDVIDTTGSEPWEKDSPDIFLGLYDWHGPPHTNYWRGEVPDYQFRLLPTGVDVVNLDNLRILSVASDDYFWQENPPFGYKIEGRFSWVELADITGDSLFNPQNGQRIPFDVSINDADGGGEREGIMTWSPYNDDTSWMTPADWLYTWVFNPFPDDIGENPTTAVPLKFELKQNYPNPFNPSTTIEYSLAKQGEVRLEIFNTLGQVVSTPVHAVQTAGTYSIHFNAANLPSGIYFYRLRTGLYEHIRKMVLMK